MNSSKNNTPFILSGSIIFICIALTIFMAFGGNGITGNIKNKLKSAGSKENENTKLKDSKEDSEKNGTNDKNSEKDPAHKDNFKNPEILSIINNMSDEQKAAQLFILPIDDLTGVYGTTLAKETTKNAIKNLPVGGLFYEFQNIVNKEQVKELLSTTDKYSKETVGLSTLKIIKDYGGTASPITGNPNFKSSILPEPNELSNAGKEECEDTAKKISLSLSELGFDLNLAPSGVLSNDEYSFGTNSSDVSARIAAFNKGLSDNGITGVFTDFPGNGEPSHLENTVKTSDLDINSLMADELLPYTDNLKSIKVIMFNELAYPEITSSNMPSFMSEKMVTDILRKDLKYNNLVISPKLKSESLSKNFSDEDMSVMAIIAGCDMIYAPKDYKNAYNAVLSSINSGRISKKRLEESLYRIISLKKSLES